MAEQYVTWLLAPGGVRLDKDDVAELCGELKVQGSELDARPKVGLWLEDGRTQIVAAADDDAKELLGRVRKGPVTAFSLLPEATLQRLDGREILHGGAILRVTYPVGDADAGPYFRRFLQISKGGTTAQDPDREGLEVAPWDQVQRPAPDREAVFVPLFIDPVRVSLPAGQLTIFNGLVRRLAKSCCFFLPAVREKHGADSYYHEDRRATRRALDTKVRELQGPAPSPLALRLWELLDDPLLRDFVGDGVVLRPGVRADDRGDPRLCTVMMLPPRTVVEGPIAAVADYRRESFGFDDRGPDVRARARAGTELPGPEPRPAAEWLPFLCDRLFSDLEGLRLSFDYSSSGYTPPGPDANGFDRIPPLRARRDSEGADAENLAWARLNTLRCRLPETPGSVRSTFDSDVLNPSQKSDPRYAHDHELAEEAFVEHFWRCPWSHPAPWGPWRQVLSLILDQWLHRDGTNGTKPVELQSASNGRRGFDPFARFKPSGPWPRLSRRERPLFIHLPRPDEQDLDRWLLQLPEGTIVREGGTMRLDDPDIRLDEGFVLAE